MPLTLPEFIYKWKSIKLAERRAAQQHFLDLCEVLHEPKPAEIDAEGTSYAFEKHVAKARGGKGFADIWKRGHFAWEYKSKGGDLHAAYLQLQDYRDDLENPPLLVTCDLQRFEVHTNFVNTKPKVYGFTLDDLLQDHATPECTLPPLEVLRAVFGDYEVLRPESVARKVTESAAARFAAIAERLELEGPHRLTDQGREQVAHFLMRLLFCLFADSIGLLPERLFREMVEQNKGEPQKFLRKLRGLFASMAEKGTFFGPFDIPHFNGGLFEDDTVLELSPPDMKELYAASRLDWSTIEPAIFGTLFERSLNKGKRKLIGAHYTDRDDIRLLVEPVLMQPLRRRWEAVQAGVLALEAELAHANPVRYRKLRQQMEERLVSWAEELSRVRVLDPACGSGNFLYVALRAMLDLWLEATRFAAARDLKTLLPESVGPQQLYGIETDFYAHELASIVVWIGYLQWRHEKGQRDPAEPILRKLTNIEHEDAILRYRDSGAPYEPEWPEADYVIGNPPFLGGKVLRRELGDACVDDLFLVYDGRVPAEADLVTYWFEKARALVEAGKVQRAGLLATQAIRGGANRLVLDRVQASTSIYWAQSDRPWVLDGAAVRISMVAFDNGAETTRVLDGHEVAVIHADLSSAANVASARRLKENAGICFMGTTKVGAFDLSREDGERILRMPVNPNGRPNSDVMRPWVNALDIARRPRGMYIIDFGTSMSEAEAALYEAPFEYVKKHVKPERARARSGDRTGVKWWRLQRPRPEMRAALAPLQRYIVTPTVAKHRLFAWLSESILPDHQLFTFARQDDYFFGVLHARFHEIWALEKGTALEDRPRYTPRTTFDTYPFPWPPGTEPKDDSRVRSIARAAQRLVERRDAWLNPEDATAAELAKRTLTNLYNQRPQWLADLHTELDEAVASAYGWAADLPEDQVLERLLALNLERAAATGMVEEETMPGEESDDQA